MTDQTNKTEDTAARAGLYELFSHVLLTEIDLETLGLLRSKEWSKAIEALGINVPEANDHVVEELAIDYCGIFVGPKDFCPPYQSVWENGQLQGQVLDSMNEYRGIVNPQSECPVKDHAGLQFEIMALILRFDVENRDGTFGLAESFFRNHIAWTARMLGRATKLADTEFYQTLLAVILNFIQDEVASYGLQANQSAPSPS